MYRTDKQFMRDPATASSRIYIGNIAETVVVDNLEQKFRAHGNILGLVLQRGFGFIQFETEEQAHTAIQKEHGNMFYGRKLNVRQAQAFDPKKKDNRNMGNQNQPPPNVMNNPPPAMEKQQKEPEREQQQPPPPVEEQSQSPPESMHSGPGQDKGKKRRMRNNPREMDNRRMPPDNYRDPPPFYGRQDPYGPGYVPPPIEGPPERNDCEIIVVSKPLTEYAEYIEQRLKSLGLIVDLLFPNEDVPIGRVLANISSRGCLYAILVMPQNEEHRSLTLDILHGIPQEHRNMPIEDALLLITRNFDAYMRGEKTGLNPTTGIGSLIDRHPEHIQMLLNLLAENRQITTAQYDRLIKYLLQRRDLQSEHEIAEGTESTSDEPTSKQAELQSRILNILNKTNEEAPKPVAPPAAPPTGPTPLLNDPSVQKALDSLLSGEMFKSISGV